MAERVAVSATCDLSSKISILFHNNLIFGTLLHSLHRMPNFPFWGAFGLFLIFHGEKMGMLLNANEPSPRPGVQPFSL